MSKAPYFVSKIQIIIISDSHAYCEVSIALKTSSTIPDTKEALKQILDITAATTSMLLILQLQNRRPKKGEIPSR